MYNINYCIYNEYNIIKYSKYKHTLYNEHCIIVL